jgi:hypothetical protein
MAKSETRDYAKPASTILDGALRAIRDLGYKIDSIDKNNGLINFKTGMSWRSWAGQEMSVLVLGNGDNASSVDISSRRSQTGVILQVYDWGEKGKIAKKVFAGMEKYLG